MLIRDSIIKSLQRNGGITRYWLSIIKGQALDDLHVVDTNSADDTYYSFSLERVCPVQIKRYLPFLAFCNRTVVFHSSYYRYSLQRNRVKNVVTVHDCTYEKFSKGLTLWVHRTQKFLCLWFADHIIYVSQNTKKDTEYFYPFTKRRASTIIYHGVSEDFMPLSDSIRTRKIKGSHLKPVIFVGSRDGYKQFDFAVRALGKLGGHTLLIVGGGHLTRDELDLLRTNSVSFRHYEDVDDSTLNELYNKAVFLFYPSVYEGFGLPVIEAYSAKCPVIGYAGSSVTELHSDTRLLMQKLTYEEFMRCFRVLVNKDLATEVVEENSRFAQKFRWNRCQQQHAKIYKTLLDK